jgi:FO synthase
MSRLAPLLSRARASDKPSADDAMVLASCDDLAAMMAVAAEICDRGHGDVISYSRKVFIPLTKLCRDSCHYCTFAHPPRRGERSYLTPDDVIAIAQAGAAAGCREALFTLGDKPELRYRAARDELAALGHQTTISYLAAMSALVLEKTGLLPHLNPGVMSARELAELRQVSVSQGLMLETAAERLSQRGGPHFGSPDKRPAVRLEMIGAAGEAAVPFTSGILIGIGETRGERLQAMLHLRDLHERHGHLQEIIIQNFRAKPGTRMAGHAEPDLDDHLWTIAAARILFGPDMNIQAPPNLSPGALQHLIAAGINDWGGVSPVTPDHVNPERPWPELDRLERETAKSGKVLVERLAIYPAYARQPDRWLEPKLRSAVLRASDAEGFARVDRWSPGTLEEPRSESLVAIGRNPLASLLDRAVAGRALSDDDVVSLFASRGEGFHIVCAAADALRKEVSGNVVTYVVTRNINYTNVCSYRCKFCAFSKGKLSENLRGRPYDLSLTEIQRRTVEAWDRGAVEVCLQGGIHPDYDGATYLAICRAIKDVCPAIHVHAFSPLEVRQGAATLGIPVRDFLIELKAAGLGSMPGTAAEVLDDEVRAIICPDKVTTAQWLEVVEAAHRLGIRTTATIMFGHVDGPRHWARHLLHVRDLQARTGGFTEFVPLPFVPMETPIHLHGRSRLGPTFREAVLMHAVARLALHPNLTNIQTSWVKMGRNGAAACLQAGANDLGGTLMNESITRAAGAMHGQEMSPEAMEELIASIGRQPRQRATLYGPVPAHRTSTSFGAALLSPPIETPARRYERTVRSSRRKAEHGHNSESAERTA